MLELYNSVARVFTKLLKLQQADPPPIVWEGVAKVMRFALLGLLLLSAFLLVQTIICITQRKMRSALFLALAFVISIALPMEKLLVPVAVAPQQAVMSITVQTPAKNSDGKAIYGNDVVLGAAQTQQLAQTLEKQTCRRTLAQTLPTPEKNTYNLIVALEGDKQYQLRLTPQKGWRYFTEGTDFLCVMSDYDAFYTSVQGFL